MRERPWGPPASAPRLLLPLLLFVLLLAGRPASCGYCGGEVAARMGLDGDGPPDAAGHISNSENGRFIYGVASSPGKRASMEDFFEARIDDVDGEKVGMFGVYDGHGGVRAAEYVKQNLYNRICSLTSLRLC